MNKTLMRFLSIALLMMVSIGAWAQEKYVTVNLGANNDGKFDNGTIVEAGQEREGDAVTVTLTVTPATGYTFNKNNVTIYATLSSFSGTRTRTPEISKTLTLDGPTGDATKATDYTVTVDANLGVWVESATFNKVSSPQKGPQNAGTTGTVKYCYIHCRQSNNTGYYLVPAYGYYNDNDDMPYLTTYQTGKDANSIWRVEKVNFEGDEQDYYRFIHNATGKYITANDALSGFDAGRFRFHLQESSTPDDAMLFILKEGTNGRYAIRSKDYIVDNGSDSRYWWDMAGGNKNNYWAGLIDQSGILGIWNMESNPTYNWELDPATATCATPIINYNETDNTFSISYPGDNTDISIHYTVDGSEPTADSPEYGGAIAQGSVTDKVRAVAMKTDYENSMVAEMDPPKTYMFMTNDAANVSYYMIPPLDDTSTTDIYVTTSNVPNEKMVWQIKPATFDGVQSYYLYNPATGKYAYCNGNLNNGSALVMKPLGEEGTEIVRYKFCLYHTGDYYNIVPKKFSYKLPTAENNCLFKSGGNNSVNYIGLSKDNANGYPRWQFVLVPDEPKTLFDRSFAPTVEGVVPYWKIQSVSDNSYYVTAPSNSNVFATASKDGSNLTWFFEEADTDEWNTYYYIRNAVTGGYLYYDADRDTNNKFLTSSTPMGEISQFVVARTANASSYNIIPRPIKDTPNQANIAMNRGNTTLRIGNSRNNGNAQWNLVADNDFKCEEPSFSYTSSGSNVILTIISPTPDASIYYTTDGSDPDLTNTESTHILYSGAVTIAATVSSVKMIAARSSDGSDQSEVVSFEKPTIITQASEITSPTGIYILGEDFSFDRTATIHFDGGFQGTIDGQMNTFTISCPLFDKVENATIKNVILDNVTITSGDDEGNTGAIACVATGTTRIYNCGILATNSDVETDDDGYTKITSNSSTVEGSGYTGGLVGLLDGEARVINCFSYADITGGTNVGGIVGYNNVATTSQNLKTMVMNCMFYGDIKGGTNKAPIYNGTNIVNKDDTGVSNFNYFWGAASYVQDRDIDTYNCALMAETRFLQRFEFFRHLLNGHRELAAWWATGSTANKDQMMKWVMEPSQIGSTTPYPILKAPGYYPSAVNIDAENATTQTERNKGGKLGELAVTIEMGTGGAQYGPPTGAEISTPSLTLNITDKDPDHFNFNYYKVQLPYYNDVGTKNYNGNRVVTGWKITSITTDGSVTSYNSYTTGDDATANSDGEITAAPYNFADRHCTGKDLYGTSGRIFNQGAYWDVPEGVTGITIQPYWAMAAYLADANMDVVYDKDMNNAYQVPSVGGGQIYTNGQNYSIAGENQKVYTTIGNAANALGKHSGHTVYDYAIVLVGNYHKHDGISSSDVAHFYTIMSVDFDHDNEPDYSYILRFNSRTESHPVRVDFLNIPGLGMAQKSTDGKGTYNFGIMQPIGWFESTNTSLFRVTQFEYDRSNRGAAPLILQGGVMEQWVSDQNNDVANKTTYFHMGGNVWFKEFHRGTHIDKNWTSTHPPLSVTGGDYDEFYLTGLYKAVTKTNDDAECYINGGRFGIVAGTGMEGIGDDNNDANTKGNIIWQIQNADIDEFYGGGINAASRIGGNITTVITGSHVGQFCGGPKFGDLYPGKTVITTAKDCEFGTYFGAGYGGNSYSIFPPQNINNTNGDYGANNWNKFVNDHYKQEYENVSATATTPAYNGVSTDFYYQYLPMSNNTQNVERIFVKFVIFSLATTHNVTSTLTSCTINGNFYGGGSLGKVDGPVTSTLTDCTVKGNVFGAGYSADKPSVEVMNTGGFVKAPFYDVNLGAYMEPTYPSKINYTWAHAETVNSTENAIDKTNHILYTTVNLEKSNLGSVAGTVSLTIDGSSDKGSIISGNVYGGGEQSYVTGTDNTVTVTLKGKTTVIGSVYGGGDQGVVEGSTTVNIKNED